MRQNEEMGHHLQCLLEEFMKKSFNKEDANNNNEK